MPVSAVPWLHPGRGLALVELAEQLKASDIGLEFLTGDLQGQHDPSGIVFTVLAALSGMDREYIRDRTLEGHESARARGKSIGGATVTDAAMLSHALHLRDQQGLSLRDIAARLVISHGAKKGQHPSPATVLRMFRDHDSQAAPSTELATEDVLAGLRPKPAKVWRPDEPLTAEELDLRQRLIAQRATPADEDNLPQR